MGPLFLIGLFLLANLAIKAATGRFDGRLAMLIAALLAVAAPFLLLGITILQS